MSNVDIRETINIMNQVLSTQVDSDTRVHLKPNASTTASRNRDFERMNPPTFFGFKVKEDSKWLIIEVSKVLEAMGVSYKEKAELVAYQLKDVAHVLYD